MAFDPKKFKTNEAKPLPVILLLDTSGSMSTVMSGPYTKTGQTGIVDGQRVEFVNGGSSRIQTLNTAVQTMLETLAKEENNTVKFLTSIITFDSSAKFVVENKNASEIKFQDLSANGMTAMGAALKLAKAFIEDKSKIPSRAFRPTVVLVSDGEPNDDWQKPLDDFTESGRTSKCDRWAMGIGGDISKEALRRFIAGTNNKLIHANEAKDILDFFKMVTMSVSVRSVSQNPNNVPTQDAVGNFIPVGDKNSGSPLDEFF
jgi:uncharacterized protein YegL